MSQQRAEQQPSTAQIVTLIAGALALGASVKATATSLSAVIGVPVAILTPVLKIAMSRPIKYGIATLPSATALSESQKLEATYRAHYVYAASQRLASVKSGEPYNRALRMERQYFNQHLAAMANRRSAASQVDQAARRYGQTLGWHAKMDSLTSPECRQANGKNFDTTRIPAIGWPGAVHPHCRCKPGRKFTTSQTVYSVKPDQLRKAK